MTQTIENLSELAHNHKSTKKNITKSNYFKLDRVILISNKFLDKMWMNLISIVIGWLKESKLNKEISLNSNCILI